MNPYEIMAKHDYVERSGSLLDNLPPEIRKAMLAHRKNEMVNTNVAWSNYKDCPFVNKKLVKEYNEITDTGWYTKMYAIMVSIAGNAIRNKYPITAQEITTLCKEIDYENANLLLFFNFLFCYSWRRPSLERWNCSHCRFRRGVKKY